MAKNIGSEIASHENHRKHRNVLYSLVIIVLVIQTVSFVFLTAQVSKINVKIDSEIEKTREDLKKQSEDFTNNLVGEYDSSYQRNFNDITNILARQQEDFSNEINILKSTTNNDFSGIVEDAVKSVVTISTDE